MRCLHLWPFLPALLASLLSAQPPYPVGVRDFSFLNGSGKGSAWLTARIHYPAAAAGMDTPVLARPGGWPVVVHLHGYTALGSFYGPLGTGLAAAGFVAVMSDTAQFDAGLQELDGRALFAALVEAGRNIGGIFEGCLDMDRAGLLGHSMGGGNVGNVLAENPGFRCGFALSPVLPRSGNAARVSVPLGIAAGAGDPTTPWETCALPYYQALTAYRGLKFFYLLDGDCDHLNVAGLFLSGTASNEVFQRVLSVALGFFGRFLGGEASGLEQALGPAALQEPRLLSLSLELESPEPWASAPVRIGKTARISVAAEPGAAGLLVAARPGALPTRFGTLLLEEATLQLLFAGLAGPERRIDWSFSLPADPFLVGLSLYAQAFGATSLAPVRLGASARFEVVP